MINTLTCCSCVSVGSDVSACIVCTWSRAAARRLCDDFFFFFTEVALLRCVVFCTSSLHPLLLLLLGPQYQCVLALCALLTGAIPKGLILRKYCV